MSAYSRNQGLGEIAGLSKQVDELIEKLRKSEDALYRELTSTRRGQDAPAGVNKQEDDNAEAAVAGSQRETVVADPGVRDSVFSAVSQVQQN